MAALGLFVSACDSAPTPTTAQRNSGISADARKVARLVNDSRATNSLAALTINATLSQKADGWARTLAQNCSLSHSDLTASNPYNWKRLGENVGYGGTIEQVHDAYMKSPGHRANILDNRFNYIGTASVTGTCNGRTLVFTVQEFMQL